MNEQLEQCRAPQKVAILDCCQSGGFSLGFRTRGAKSASNPTALLNSRGVYVISSSGADESSYGGGTSVSDPLPSVFTGELVEALRTGRGDTGNDGIISMDELFHYVNKRVRLDDLEPSIDIRTPVSGARNTAVLFLVSRQNQANTGLLKDLEYIAGKSDAIKRTALGALLGELAAQQASAITRWQQVALLPLNEGKKPYSNPR